MNDTQIALVQESWARVAAIPPTAATLFYDRLFSVAPGVRALFPDDMTQQKQKLMEMLGIVVDSLGRLDSVVGELEALGRRHAGYGAVPEHYDVVGECLLWTLGQGLGEEFTPDVRHAWATAYSILASTMITAQAAEKSEPSSAM